MKIKLKWLLFFLLIIIGAIVMKKNLSSFRRQNFYEHFNLSRKNIYVAIEDKYDLENPVTIKNNQIYFPVELIQNYIDKYIFWDSNQNQLTITNWDEVIKIRPDNLTYYTNNEPVIMDTEIYKENGRVYIPQDFLSENYNLDINYNEKNKIVTVDFKNKTYSQAKVKHKTNLRYIPNKKGYIAGKVPKREKFYVYEEKDGFTRIRSNGLIGYIPTKKIIDTQQIAAEKINLPPQKKFDGKIKMAWELTTNTTANYYALQKKFPDTLNVISPTWFTFDTEKLNGDIIDIVDKNYIEKARQNNCQIWPSLTDNLDYKLTDAIFSDTIKRSHVINQLLDYVAEYNFEGINIDIEAISKDTAKYFLQFLRELAPLIRKQNAILSVNIFVPQAWSMYHDRQMIGQTADYICLMAYDEHTNGSNKSGPVASYEFVLNGIKDTLKEVPKEKILLGIPFYVRIWRETDSSLSLENYSMDDGFRFFDKRNVKFEWLDFEKCYYGEFSKSENHETVTYKTWLEDEKSIEEKLKLAKKFDLAGICAWRKNLETNNIWNLIDEYIKY